MKLVVKIIIGYLLIAVLVYAISFDALRSSRTAADSMADIASQTMPVINSLKEIRTAGLNLINTSDKFFLFILYKRDGLISSDETYSAELFEKKKEIEARLIKGKDSYKDLVARYFPDEKVLLNEIERTTNNLKELSNEIVGASNYSLSPLDVVDFEARTARLEKEFISAVDAALAREDDELEDRKTRLENILQQTENEIILYSILAFSAVLALAIIIARSITRPFQELVAAAAEIGLGNLDKRLEVKSKDEMGQLAVAFNRMSENLQLAVKRETELATAAALAQERADTEKDRADDRQKTIIELDRQITERLLSETGLRRNLDTQNVISKLLSYSLEDVSLEDILEQTLDAILNIPWLVFEKKGAVFLVEDQPGKLVMKHHHGLAAPIIRECSLLDFGRCICGRAAQAGKTLFVDCIDERHEVSYDGIIPHGHYCVPILYSGRVLGVINVYVKDGHVYRLEEEEFLTTVANTLAGIIIRKQSERELQSERDKFEAIFTTVGDGLMIIDPDFRILYQNSKHIEFQGSHEGEECFRVFHQKDAVCDGCLVRKTFADGRVYRREISVETKMGELDLEIASGPIRDSKGRIIACFEVVRDISEHKKLEDRFLQAQKMEAVGQLAGGVAHDFNNLLTGIIGFTGLAKDGAGDNTQLSADLDEVLSLARKAANLTRQLLAFSRQQALEKVELNVAQLVDNLAKMLKRLLGEDVIFEFKPGDEPGIVMADPGQLEQVLVNLAVNARQAMPAGGQLRIETANVNFDEYQVLQSTHEGMAPGSYVVISVADTGCGMDKLTMEQIFEPFFTTKEMGAGTGLGLSTVYGIIKQHSGYIWAYSEPGQGTTFKIYLPRLLEGQATVEQRPAETETVGGGTETILVVEDEAVVRRVTRRMLKNLGYTIIMAEDPAQAEIIFAEKAADIDLLLTDIIMPKRNGWELYQSLARTKPGLKVLFMSGYAEDVISEKSFLAMDHPFINKPFSQKKLAEKIRSVLEEEKKHA